MKNTTLIGFRFTQATTAVNNDTMKMQTQTGFTLVELMITVAIGMIILTLAVPSFNETIENNRITTQTNDLVAALNLTRMEAIHRGTSVSICASSNQASCSGSNDWSSGWIVYEDSNTTGTTAIKELIRTWSSLSGSPSVTASNSATFLRYSANGALGNSRTIAHQVTNCSGTQRREISISAAGRVSTDTASCSS